MTIDVETLITVEDEQSFLSLGLELAQAAGLLPTSWRTGDPTKSLYQWLARVLGTRDGIVAEFIKGAFLSKARGDWLTVLASEVYGVDRILATAAAPTLHLNAGGRVGTINPNEVTFKSASSGATFHNTNTVTLSADCLFELEADEAGSGGTVAVNEVDTMVTTLLGASIISSTAAIGLDEQDDDSLIQDCKDTLGALSPNGAPDAYEYVVRRPKFTGVTTITRSRATSDDPTGHVNVYLAGPDGAVDGASVTAAQTAIDTWCTPLTVTATAYSAATVTVNVTATIYGTDIPADYESQLTGALGAFFAKLPIADESGYEVAPSAIDGVFHDTLALRKVVLTSPADVVSYTVGKVPVLGAVTITEG